MNEDFFRATAPYLAALNQTDRSIYDYVVRNMEAVKDESIRTLSHECFVSTATMFRFVQKLGFEGYADFINLLRLTCNASLRQNQLMSASMEEWTERYTASIQSALRMLSEQMLETFRVQLSKTRSLLILAGDGCEEAALYAKRRFSALGCPVLFLCESYELKNAERNISSEDMLFVISAGGQEQRLLEQIRRFRAERQPYLVSIVAQRGVLQALSDLSVCLDAQDGAFLHGAIAAEIELLAQFCRRGSGQVREIEETEAREDGKAENRSGL